MLFIIAFKNTSLVLFFLIKQDIGMAEKLSYLKRSTAYERRKFRSSDPKKVL